MPLLSRDTAVGEEGAAGLLGAHRFDRARDLIAARGEEAGEGEPRGPRGLIAVIGEDVRECALRQIAASGDLTAASGEEVSDVELFLQKRWRDRV